MIGEATTPNSSQMGVPVRLAGVVFSDAVDENRLGVGQKL